MSGTGGGDPGATTPVDRPDVSVIIPARNAASSIRRQLEAVCAQRIDREVEVVVVDNGSTDDTPIVVRSFSSDHPAVRLVEGPLEPNRSAARNVGVAHARGDVLAFCDADDVVQTGWLLHLVNALGSHDAVSGSLVSVADSDDLRPHDDERFPTTYRGIHCLGSNNMALPRRLFERIGGFSEDFKHRVDIELSCRLLLHGARLGYEPLAEVRYTRRSSLRAMARQHFWWAVADARIQKVYGRELQLSYSWKNSLKHWLRVGPALVRAVVLRRDSTPPAITLATLLGQLVGSVRYGVLAI